MRMAFRHFKKLPENFRFIADGYSAYVLAAQQFLREYGDDFKFIVLNSADNMPGKWQLLIFLGQQTIMNIQRGEAAICS